jgi:hypothetical protein
MDETWALVKGTVLTKQTPPFKVKGIAQPIQAYEVLGLTGAPTKSLPPFRDSYHPGPA